MDNPTKLNTLFPTYRYMNLAALSLVLMLTGCAYTYSPRAVEGSAAARGLQTVVTETPPVTAQQDIAAHAAQVNQSLEELYAIEKAKKPENLIVKATPALGPMHPTLRQPLSIDWSGPVEPLLAEIALRTHYRLKIMGVHPPIPLLVSVNMREAPAHEVLQNIRSQIYERGDLLIFPEQRVMELHYLD